MTTTKVYFASGSRHTVPPGKNSPGAPRIIATLSTCNLDAFTFKVISKYDDSLKHQDYDKNKYLHISPTFMNRFLEVILNYVPLKLKKRLFGYALSDRIVYYQGIRRLIKKEKPDIVITFMHFELFKKLCKALPKAKHIYFFRSTNLKLRLGDENIKFLLDNSSGFLANTKSPIQELKSIATDVNFPTETIYNSIRLQDFSDKISLEQAKAYRKNLNLKPTDFVLGYAGRLSEEKSILELLESIKHFKDKNQNIHLLIAGSITIETTPNKHYYKKIMDFVEAHLSDQVHFLGWIPNESLHEFYNALDIGILLSKYSEGNSMFLLESMSMGTPVIATNIGGNVEIINHQENGFLIDSEHIQENLIHTIELLWNDTTQLKKMSEKAVDYVKQYHTDDIMLDKFNNFIKQFE